MKKITFCVTALTFAILAALPALAIQPAGDKKKPIECAASYYGENYENCMSPTPEQEAKLCTMKDSNGNPCRKVHVGCGDQGSYSITC